MATFIRCISRGEYQTQAEDAYHDIGVSLWTDVLNRSPVRSSWLWHPAAHTLDVDRTTYARLLAL